MKYLYAFLFAVILISTGCTEKNQKIAQWRGINRDGIYSEKGLLNEWPSGGPQLLWETDTVGNGYSSPVIYDDKLYINGENDSVSYLFAFDLKGNLLWKAPNGPEFTGVEFSAGFPGARSTPTIYKGLAYISSGLGRIACIEIKTGKEVWSKHMVNDLKGELNYFGYCESLLIDGNVLFCFPGGKESNVVCLDRLTGNAIWTSKALADNVAFTSPILIKLKERNLFVTMSKNNLFALDATDGKLLWSFPEDSVKFEGAYCNTPLYENGYLYNVSGVEKGSGTYKLKISPNGESYSVEWKNQRVRNEMGGFIKLGDSLYVASDDKKIKLLDANTGIVVDSLRNIRGNLIFADGKFYCYSDNGNIDLIRLINGKLSSVSKFKIDKGTKEHLAHIVIHKGVLYVRHGKSLQAFKIS
ncbi:MAG: PQQ-binding-like beta-propeller repeat protein [Prolixibacteraceae bacterium]|nr:PQQ-binding-like beta-propeller repeat protein [Prolixibacteraceae bacterium]